MGKLRAIVWTSFQETLHRKVLYLVLALALLVIAMMSSQLVYAGLAQQAGETEAVTNLARQLFVQIMGTWEFAAFFLALFLGAVAISSELKSKTIVTVLARPVPRWLYLLGRWIGVLLFLWAFLLVGIAIAMLWGACFGLTYSPVLWLGFADLFVTAIFLSGISIGLSVLLPPVAAGALTLFLLILPGMVKGTMGHPIWIYRTLSTLGYYIAPAQMRVDYIGDSFKKEMIDPKYSLFAQVLLENLLYTGAVLLIACWIFKRRELRLR